LASISTDLSPIAREAEAFVDRQREPVVDVLVGDPPEEPQAVLVERLDLAVLQRRQRGRIRHVRVQDAACLRQLAVQRGVDVPGGRIGRMRPLERRRVGGIEQREIAGADAREMPPARVHQKPPAIVGDRDAEVVRDPLVPAEPCSPAERRRQIDPQLPLGRFDSHFGSGLAGKGGHRQPPASNPDDRAHPNLTPSV
jgi:hypothetical protein